MSLDKLKAYRINSAYTEGVDIYLDDARDVAFRVVLPGPYNRPYIAELYSDINISFDEDDTATSNLIVAANAQIEAFMKHCLISIDGEPPPENFERDYPKALEELMKKAQELVVKIESEVEKASKKLSPTSIGNVGGATG